MVGADDRNLCEAQAPVHAGRTHLPWLCCALKLWLPCRMEPLVMVDAEKRKPMYVPYYRGGRRLHIGMAEFAEDVGGGVSRAAMATSGAVVGG